MSAPLRLSVIVNRLTRRLSSRGGCLWSVPVGAIGWIAKLQGALAPVVDEARRRTDLPAHTRLQMIWWSSVVVHGSSLPARFRPGQQILDPTARCAAVAALRLRKGSIRSDNLAEQIISLDDEMSRSELVDSVRTDLSERFASRATRPKRGDGVDPQQLTTIIDDVLAQLAQAGITPFLMSGTLLGFVREGTFLAHDHDVDLGLLPDVNLVDVAAALSSSGLEIQMPVDGQWLVAIHDSGLHVDFFRHDLRDGIFWHQTQIHKWWNTPFRLKELKHEGRSWWIPEHPHRYLDENYGNWDAPVAFYDASFDTPNRHYIDDAQAIRHLHNTCSRALLVGDRWLVESAARELRDMFGIDVTLNLAPSPLVEPRKPDVAGELQVRGAGAPRHRSSRWPDWPD
jgi:hypothetical protein